MRVLILVNPQVDFCAGGALEISGAEELLQHWYQQLGTFDQVIGLREWHSTDHISFAQNHLWRRPGQKITIDDKEILLQISHCVAGQFGAFLCTPFQESDFSTIVNLGSQKDLETEDEIISWWNTNFEKNWNDEAPASITIAGLAHNDIISKLSTAIAQAGIEVHSPSDNYKLFTEPNPF